MKLKKIAKKSLSMLLATALAVSGLALDNSSVLNVKAEENTSTPLSVTAFATPEQLMSSDNFALHTDTGSSTAQKVYFGMNGESQQTWYIAGGEDHDGDGTKDSIVLLCDPSLPMATGIMFEDDLIYNKTYSADWNCTYETAPNEVYPNHYGASDLRGVLQGYTSNDNTEKFSAAEKELMQSTKVYTDDDKRKDEGETDYTYYTEDVLYPAYGDYDDVQYITVGVNSAESLKGGLKVSLTSAPYNGGDNFWLRAPNSGRSNAALVAYPGDSVSYDYVNYALSVVPAFRLNLSSVLFASVASAATSGASLTDTMTFRVDGAQTENKKITSKATYAVDGVMVDASDSETVYLYVQGKDGTMDWVYSQEISEDTTIATDTIKSGAKDSSGQVVSPASVDLSQCRIWLEKKVAEDNLVYAVMAKTIETVATVELTDITAPVAGAELDVAATCNTTGVSTTTPTVSYTKNGESVSGNAEAFASYTAVVELEAADSYVFTDETTATVNGNEASVSFDDGTGRLTVSYTFDKTAKLPLGNAYFVTVDELMGSFDLDGTDDTVGKVYFGTNATGASPVPQTWYVAGSDADNSIVLLCDPALPMATVIAFENNSTNKDYSSSWDCIYETLPSEVYPNHYGASALRLNTLKTLETNTNIFTTSEQNMMLATKVYTKDDKLKNDYYTEDKLYAAYGEYYGNYITVGTKSADGLYGAIKVSLILAPYNSGDDFWLRAPYDGKSDLAIVTVPGVDVLASPVDIGHSVVPAFRLNLSSVLFASAASAATSGASLENDGNYNIYAFRLDGTGKFASEAVYTAGGVTVKYDEGDGNVFLYVQDADSVYSVKITEDTTVALTSMTDIDSLTDESTKIWLEKSEDKVAYAVMAEAVSATHVEAKDATCKEDGNSEYWYFTVDEATYYFSDADCSVALTNIPTVESEGHKDDNTDGKCDICATAVVGAVDSNSLSLNGDISVNFYMKLDESVTKDESAVLLFTVNGEETEVPVSSIAAENDGTYKFSIDVAAAQMADEIKAQVITKTGEGATFTYSVAEYARAVFDDDRYATTTAPLMKAMLNFGTYAQSYFDYNTASPANSVIKKEEDRIVEVIKADTLNEYASEITGALPEGAAYTGSTLLLESEVTIRHYFTFADKMQLPEVSAGWSEWTKKGGEYYTEMTGIVAAELDEMKEFSINNSWTIRYSALSYAKLILEKDANAVRKGAHELMSALYYYNCAANTYFNNQN